MIGISRIIKGCDPWFRRHQFHPTISGLKNLSFHQVKSSTCHKNTLYSQIAPHTSPVYRQIERLPTNSNWILKRPPSTHYFWIRNQVNCVIPTLSSSIIIIPNTNEDKQQQSQEMRNSHCNDDNDYSKTLQEKLDASFATNDCNNLPSLCEYREDPMFLFISGLCQILGQLRSNLAITFKIGLSIIQGFLIGGVATLCLRETLLSYAEAFCFAFSIPYLAIQAGILSYALASFTIKMFRLVYHLHTTPKARVE